MIGTWLPWFALLLLAVLSSWASMALYQPLPTAAKRSEGADHAFIQPQARVFDKTGRSAYDLRGAQLEHRAESGEHLLMQAEMRVYPQGDQGATQRMPLAQTEHWLVQAERARVMNDREHVQLEGQVEAQRQGVPTQNRITLHARDVTLTLKTQIADSTQPIQIEGANWQSRSGAFHANFSTEQFEQTGRVHDRYQPPQP